MLIHVVRPGDSMYRIATHYGVPLPYLLAQNGLAAQTILTPGQAVIVPVPEESYTVRRGDTLGKIATRTGVSVMQLWQNNPFLQGKERILPGQYLAVRFPGNRLGKMAVNGYVYPAVEESILRKTLPYLTYLSVFSFGFDADGRVRAQDVSGLTRLARAYGAKPMLVLSTLGEDGRFSGERAHALLGNAEMQRTLTRSLLEVLHAQNFAGVDVDFEYVPAEDAARYAAFVSELRRTLQDFLVFVALAPKTSAEQKGLLYEAHDYRALGAAAEAALVMTYEWGYAGSAPMAVAPIDKVAGVMDYAVTAIPPSKLLLGLPNYGYTWSLPYVQGRVRAQSIGNMQAVEQAVRYGAAIEFDTVAQTPFYRFWRERTQWETWFEDARSVRAKLLLAAEYGLLGVSVWTVMRFFPALWLELAGRYTIEKEPVK